MFTCLEGTRSLHPAFCKMGAWDSRYTPTILLAFPKCPTHLLMSPHLEFLLYTSPLPLLIIITTVIIVVAVVIIACMVSRFSCFQLCVTLWTVARRLLCPWDSPGKYWSGLPFPSPRDLPEPGIKPGSPALQAD